MKSKLHLFLYLTSLPFDFFGWLVIVFIRVAWGSNLRWESPHKERSGDVPGGPVLTCDIKAGSFPVTPGRWPKGFYLHQRPGQEPRSWGATTLGHAIFYGPSRRQAGKWLPIQVHEHTHVEQYEAAMLGSFFVGAVVTGLMGSWLAGLLIWASGGLVMLAANWTTAVLRGEDAYRGSHHEEAAYAIEAAFEQQQKE